MRLFVSGVLIIVGVIHLLPVLGVSGGERLNDLYGIDNLSKDLHVLMRHRAVLFGILGGLMCYASFSKHFQNFAIVAGIISTGSFVLLASIEQSVNDKISTVVLIDYVALGLLGLAAIFRVREHFSSKNGM